MVLFCRVLWSALLVCLALVSFCQIAPPPGGNPGSNWQFSVVPFSGTSSVTITAGTYTINYATGEYTSPAGSVYYPPHTWVALPAAADYNNSLATVESSHNITFKITATWVGAGQAPDMVPITVNPLVSAKNTWAYTTSTQRSTNDNIDSSDPTTQFSVHPNSNWWNTIEDGRKCIAVPVQNQVATLDWSVSSFAKTVGNYISAEATASLSAEYEARAAKLTIAGIWPNRPGPSFDSNGNGEFMHILYSHLINGELVDKEFFIPKIVPLPATELTNGYDFSKAVWTIGRDVHSIEEVSSQSFQPDFPKTFYEIWASITGTPSSMVEDIIWNNQCIVEEIVSSSIRRIGYESDYFISYMNDNVEFIEGTDGGLASATFVLNDLSGNKTEFSCNYDIQLFQPKTVKSQLAGPYLDDGFAFEWRYSEAQWTQGYDADSDGYVDKGNDSADALLYKGSDYLLHAQTFTRYGTLVAAIGTLSNPVLGGVLSVINSGAGIVASLYEEQLYTVSLSGFSDYDLYDEYVNSLRARHGMTIDVQPPDQWVTIFAWQGPQDTSGMLDCMEMNKNALAWDIHYRCRFESNLYEVYNYNSTGFTGQSWFVNKLELPANQGYRLYDFTY